LDLKLTQPLYRGGRTEAATRQALNTVQSTRAQTLGVETTVFQAVAQAYLDVVRDQTLVEVNRNNEQVLRRQLEATQDRFRVGEVTRSYAPSVSLRGSRQDTASLVAQLTVPLYEGGLIWSQTRQAEQTVGQRRSQVDDARRLAVQQATSAWESLQSGRAAIVSFGAAVRAAQIALEGVQQ